LRINDRLGGLRKRIRIFRRKAAALQSGLLQYRPQVIAACGNEQSSGNFK